MRRDQQLYGSLAENEEQPNPKLPKSKVVRALVYSQLYRAVAGHQASSGSSEDQAHGAGWRFRSRTLSRRKRILPGTHGPRAAKTSTAFAFGIRLSREFDSRSVPDSRSLSAMNAVIFFKPSASCIPPASLTSSHNVADGAPSSPSLRMFGSQRPMR